MANWSLDFDAPQYLWLLVLLPFFWLVSRESLHALGTWRRRAALALRMIVATLLVLALAEPNWLELAHRLSVLFVVDGSSSIDQTELHDALAYVNKAVATQRDANRGDRAGVVVFGRDAATEVPPLDAPWQISKVESLVDPRFSNLAGALEMAEAAFPPDSAKRVVIVSDGNENIGNATTQAERMLQAGTGIDVVPIRYQRQGDVVIQRLDAPANLRSGTPFALRVVLDNITGNGSDNRATTGKLRITRELGGTRQVVSEEPLTLQHGKQVLTLRQELNESGLSTYEATFIPDDPATDIQSQNNSATAFCQVSGKGRVLLIEDAAAAGQFDSVVELLRRNEIEVTVRDTRRPFDNLADLQQFDAVILADVPRVTGDGADEITQFTDEQIRQLVQNTQHFGCGLIVLGGPNSFGAGGWTNTELEKALPVDFQVDNAKVEAVGALVLVVDSSGSMAGDKIAWAKAASVAAAEMLGRRDYIGVVAFDSEARWIVPLQRNGSASRTRSRIRQLGAGGGTDMMPGLAEGYRAIQGAQASIKHVIALTDGQTNPGAFNQLAAKMRAAGITTSGVAVGPDADRSLLANIAKAGGGKFYYLLDPKAIPRIFMREARRVSMPLVFEDKAGFAVNVVSPDNELSGIDALPPITGFVLTTIKQNPLVEVLASTPRQPPPNSTIMAAWTYGLGRAAVLTTDVGQRWATSWPGWANYDKLLLQLVRRSMRSHDANEQLAMSTELREGKIRLVVTALDREDEHVNYLSLSAAAVRPDGMVEEHALEQTAPGRYVATVDASEPGNYFLSVSGGAGTAPLRTAVEVLQTAEFNRLESNEAMLAGLAARTPTDGEPGSVIASPQGLTDPDERLSEMLKINVFRPGVAPAVSRSRIWPLVLLAASVIFLGDVFCRRVVFGFGWLSAVLAWLPWHGQRALEEVAPRPMDRLKHSKATVAANIKARAAARLELPETAESTAKFAAPPSAAAASAAATAPSEAPRGALAADAEPTSYTARLLAAKERARQEQQRPD
jgi:Mg-chelatase subunit ChlD